jgi:hypothetical protein
MLTEWVAVASPLQDLREHKSDGHVVRHMAKRLTDLANGRHPRSEFVAHRVVRLT